MELPPPMVTTLEDMEPYYLACEEYESVGEEDAFTAEEVEERHEGLTQEDSCGFAVFGYPTQIWLNLEADLAEAAGHKEEWVNLARTYARALMEQYLINKAGIERIEQQLTDRE